MTPTVEHFFFIPAVFVAGGVIGFLLGVNKAKAELQRLQAERQR